MNFIIKTHSRRGQILKAGRKISTLNVQPSLMQPFGPLLSFPEEEIDSVRFTKLENGIKIITQERKEPLCGIGFYVQAGARYDPVVYPGLNYVLRWSFLGSNMDSSMFQNDRTIRSIGASYEHRQLHKELLGFKIECRRDTWQEPLNKIILCSAIPRFMDTEIDRFRDTMDAQLEELRWQKPRAWCIEEVQQLAFYREPLGNPCYVPLHGNDKINGKVLLEQWRSHFLPQRIILVGINLKHDELSMFFQNHDYSNLGKAPHFKNPTKQSDIHAPKTTYQGGSEGEFFEKRHKVMTTKVFLENDTIGAIAWRIHGFAYLQDFACALVCAQLLSHCLEEPLNNVCDEKGIGLKSFYTPFMDVGLFGTTFRSMPKNAEAMVAKSLRIMKEISFSKEKLRAAKTAAMCRFFHDHLEMRRDLMDYWALEALIRPPSTDSIRNFFEAIEAVTSQEVRVCLAFARETPPCMFTTGEVLQLPSLRNFFGRC